MVVGILPSIMHWFGPRMRSGREGARSGIQDKRTRKDKQAGLLLLLCSSSSDETVYRQTLNYSCHNSPFIADGGRVDGWMEGRMLFRGIYRVDILHPLIIISCEGATKNKEGVEEKWPPAERGCGWSEGQSASQSLGAK